MSEFFEYFKNLRFILFWKENEWWPFFRAVAAMFDQLKQDIYWVRNQYILELSDPQFLDKHGRSRGLAKFPNEPEEFWVDRVKNSFKWYVEEIGRTSTLKEFFDLGNEGAGIGAKIWEYWDVDKPFGLQKMQYAEFGIEFDQTKVTKNDLNYARAITYEFKRASARPIWTFFNEYELNFSQIPDLKTCITFRSGTDGANILNSGQTFDSGWNFDEPDPLAPEGVLIIKTE